MNETALALAMHPHYHQFTVLSIGITLPYVVRINNADLRCLKHHGAAVDRLATGIERD